MFTALNTAQYKVKAYIKNFQQFIHNFLNNPADRQTNLAWQKHNLLSEGN